LQEVDSVDYTGIGISGKARSGKDTLAAILLERLGDSWRREALADALKVEWYDDCFSWQKDSITKEHKIQYTNCMKENNPHVRKELIDLGQKRRAEDPDYWIKRVNLQPKCIITDVRFKNEFDYLKARGFLMVRMECTFETLRDRGCPPIQDPSECELDNRDDWDVVVSNNAGFEVLEKAADEIVQTLYSCP
jgi:phosphomevalonate kinase